MPKYIVFDQTTGVRKESGVTSEDADLNLLDGSSVGTVANSKAVIYSAAGNVAATTLSSTGAATLDSGGAGSSFGGALALGGALSGVTTLGSSGAATLDSGGAGSSFGGALAVTGTISAATASSVGNITLANGSITDSSGAISFGNENLSTTGTLGCGVLTAATGSAVGNLTLANGSITDSSGAISFGNENLSTSGTLASGNLSVTGTAGVSGAATMSGSLTVVGEAVFTAEVLPASTSANTDIGGEYGTSGTFQEYSSVTWYSDSSLSTQVSVVSAIYPTATFYSDSFGGTVVSSSGQTSTLMRLSWSSGNVDASSDFLWAEMSSAKMAVSSSSIDRANNRIDVTLSSAFTHQGYSPSVTAQFSATSTAQYAKVPVNDYNEGYHSFSTSTVFTDAVVAIGSSDTHDFGTPSAFDYTDGSGDANYIKVSWGSAFKPASQGLKVTYGATETRYFRDVLAKRAFRLKNLESGSAPSLLASGTDSALYVKDADSKGELHFLNPEGDAAVQITAGGKINAGAMELASTSALQDNSGLDLKGSLAGTGLSMASQVLSVDASQAQITTLVGLASAGVSGSDVDFAGNVIVSEDLTVQGNLTITGDIDSYSVTVLDVADKEIRLNSGQTGSAGLDGAIVVERGDDTNAKLLWKESDDKWYQDRAGTETVVAISTDELAEGSSSLYFTDARARAAISATDNSASSRGALSYNSTSGVLTYEGISAAEVRGDISVTDAGGDGSLAYNSTSGVITYTGPSAAEVRAHLSAGEGIDISSGEISGEDATDANKGIASFASADFSVASGAVSLVDLTVAHMAADSIVLEAEGIGSNDSDSMLPSAAAVKDYVDAQVTAQDLDFQGDSGGALSIDLDSETLILAGGTGIDSSGSSNTLTFAIDSTVCTLTDAQTLTNKVMTSPDLNTPDIDGGSIDSAIIGGSTAAAGAFTELKYHKDNGLWIEGFSGSFTSGDKKVVYFSADNTLSAADADETAQAPAGVWHQGASSGKFCAEGVVEVEVESAVEIAVGKAVYLSASGTGEGKVCLYDDLSSGDLVVRLGTSVAANASAGANVKILLNIATDPYIKG